LLKVLLLYIITL